MSGGLTPCRQLRPSSRREHVKASKSYGMEKKNKKKVHTLGTGDLVDLHTQLCA